MDRTGTKKMLTILEAAYPKTYAGMDTEKRIAMIDLYESVFGEYPEEIVAAALKQYIKKNKYPPTVAGIMEIIESGRRISEDATIERYWAEAYLAITGSRKFDELSGPVQKYFRSQRAIDEIGFSEDTNLSVEKSLFMRRIAQIIKDDEIQRDIGDVLQIAFGNTKELEGK